MAEIVQVQPGTPPRSQATPPVRKHQAAREQTLEMGNAETWQPAGPKIIEVPQALGLTPLNPVIRELRWEFDQGAERHRSLKRQAARLTSTAAPRYSKHDKTIFSLKKENEALIEFTKNMMPGVGEVHYLDLEPGDKALIDELFRQQRAIEAEAQAEREKAERLREEHRKRERRLEHKGKLRKADDERKKNFDKEYPARAELARQWDETRHYLDFTPEEQWLVNELVAEKDETAAQDERTRKRRVELEAQFAKTFAEKAKREKLQADQSRAKKIKKMRSDFSQLLPSLIFRDRALEELCSIDDAEHEVFYRQFRLMQEGKTNGKHDVPDTDPKIWVLDAGNSGRVYYRQDEGNRFVIELIGDKHLQNEDYVRLRKRT